MVAKVDFDRRGVLELLERVCVLDKDVVDLVNGQGLGGDVGLLLDNVEDRHLRSADGVLVARQLDLVELVLSFGNVDKGVGLGLNLLTDLASGADEELVVLLGEADVELVLTTTATTKYRQY